MNTSNPQTVYNGQAFSASVKALQDPVLTSSLLYALDPGDKTVVAYTASSHTLVGGVSGYGLSNPVALAASSDGSSVYVVNSGSGVTWLTGNSGNPTYSNQYSVSGASAVAVTDANGKVLVGANGSVAVYTRNSDGSLTYSSTFSGNFGQASVILQVTISGSNYYLVGGSSGVQLYNASFSSIGSAAAVAGGVGR